MFKVLPYQLITTSNENITRELILKKLEFELVSLTLLIFKSLYFPVYLLFSILEFHKFLKIFDSDLNFDFKNTFIFQI